MLGNSLELYFKKKPEVSFTITGATLPFENVFAFEDEESFLIQNNQPGLCIFSKLTPETSTTPVDLIRLATNKSVTLVLVDS